jgi:hypothetical protein
MTAGIQLAQGIASRTLAWITFRILLDSSTSERRA